MGISVRIQEISKRTVGKSTFKKLITGSALFLALCGVFAYVAKQVQDGDTLTRDTEILLKINSHSSSLLDTISLGVTYTGNMLTVIMIGAALTALLYRKGDTRSVVHLLFALGGALLTNALLKLLFQRDRPELWQLLTHESTYSFPSGHALLTAALATTLVLICWNTRFRLLVLIAGIAYTGAVGVSRLYLGVHYPTDVFAGWCLGVAWALLVAIILRVVVFEKAATKSVR